MRAVDVRVRHDDEAVVAELGDVERIADGRAEGDDEVFNFLISENLIDAGLLGIEDLSTERKDRLMFAVATLLGRSSCGVSFDDIEFRFSRIAGRTVGELARKRHAFEGALADDGVAGISGGHARTEREKAFFNESARGLGIFLKEIVEPLGHDAVDDSADFAVSELGFGLAFELGFGNLYRNDRGDSFGHILVSEVRILFLEDFLFAGVLVDDAGKRRSETDQVGSAFGGVDVVDEGHHLFGIVVLLVLDGHFDLYSVDVLVDPKNVADRFVAPVQMENVGFDSPFEMETRTLPGAFVLKSQGNPAGKVGLLAESVKNRVVVESHGSEHRVVRPKTDGGSGIGSLADLFDLGVGDAALKTLDVDPAVFVNGGFELVGKSVYDRRADAMKASGNLVSRFFAAEFSTGMKHRKDGFEGGFSGFRMDVHRNSATVVGNGTRIVRMERNGDVFRVSRHGFVDGVVDDFPNEVVETAFVGRPDVHSGAFPHRLEAFENLDIAGIVSFCSGHNTGCQK